MKTPRAPSPPAQQEVVDTTGSLASSVMVVPPISHLAPPTDSQSGGPLFVWERRRMAKAGGYGISAGWGRGGRAADLECRPRILVRIGSEVGATTRGAKPSVPDGVRGGASPRSGPGRRRAWLWEDRPGAEPADQARFQQLPDALWRSAGGQERSACRNRRPAARPGKVPINNGPRALALLCESLRRQDSQGRRPVLVRNGHGASLAGVPGR